METSSCARWSIENNEFKRDAFDGDKFGRIKVHLKLYLSPCPSSAKINSEIGLAMVGSLRAEAIFPGLISLIYSPGLH